MMMDTLGRDAGEKRSGSNLQLRGRDRIAFGDRGLVDNGRVPSVDGKVLKARLGVCEPECPADAIKPDTAPNLNVWLKLNSDYASVWPNIAMKRESPADAATFDGERDKLARYFSPYPGLGG